MRGLRFLWRSLIVVWSSGSLQPTLLEVSGGTHHRSVCGVLPKRTFAVTVPVTAELKDGVFINDLEGRPSTPVVAPRGSRRNMPASSVAQLPRGPSITVEEFSLAKTSTGAVNSAVGWAVLSLGLRTLSGSFPPEGHSGCCEQETVLWPTGRESSHSRESLRSRSRSIVRSTVIRASQGGRVGHG